MNRSFQQTLTARGRCLAGLGFAASLALAAHLFSPAAPAQSGGPSVDAILLSKRLPLGEQGTLVIRIANGRPETLPQNIPVDGLVITRSERVEQKFRLGAGGNTAEFHFYYTISADRPGEFAIPGVTARVDGRDYTTEPLALSVYARDPGDPAMDASRPFFANLECQSRELWAGQVTPLTLAIYVRGVRSINDVGPPMLRHDDFVFGYERTYALDGVELDGISFTTAKRPGSVFGLTPGSYTIGPAEVQVAMIDDNSPFGRMPGFFQSFVAKTLRTNPVMLTVKPLPEAGKPGTFRSSVGNFSIEAKASPLALAVGDPISIDFEVRGPGNYETLEAPIFLPPDPAQWRTYEARKTVDSEEISDGVKPGRAVFTQIVMPQAEVTEIPPFELSFFNPETGAYQSQRTRPISIRVSADTRAASSAAAGVAIPSGPLRPGAPSPQAPFSAAATPEARYNDVVHIRTTPPQWKPIPLSLTARPVFWIGQMIPAAALLALVGIGFAGKWRARRRESGTRHVVPLKNALAAIHDQAPRTEYYRSILTALDSWTAEARAAGGGEDLPDVLSKARDALRARSQWVVYGASESDQTRPPEANETKEARQILEALRHHLD